MKESDKFLTESLKAKGDIGWLEDRGFWTLAGKLFDQMETNLTMRLKSKGNSRDDDMFIKGRLYELIDMQSKLNELMKKIKSEVGQ